MGKPVGLTVKEILALPPRDGPYEVRDPGVTGGYITVWPTGATSYIPRYRYRGRKTKLTIGRFDAAAGGLAEARRKAQKALAELAEARHPKGEALLDPATAKRAARKAKVVVVREAEREATHGRRDAVENVVADFVQRHCSKLRTGHHVARLLDRDVVSRWKGRALGEIGKAEIHQLLDDIVDRGARTQANRVYAHLQKLCRWALSRGIISHNPCDGLSRPETVRDRTLDEAELSLVWRAAGRLGAPFEGLLKLLILTGQRRGEVGEATRSEFDIDAKIWRIPAARSKNNRAHEVPLSPQVLAVIETLQRIHGARDFLFSTTGRTPVSGFSRMKAALDKTIAELNHGEPIADWSLHDLRRSTASGMARLGVNLPVIERCLNHVSGTFGGIVGVYQRHSFAGEMRAALECWGNHVARIITGGHETNVSELANDQQLGGAP